MSQRVTYTRQVGGALDRALAALDCARPFVLADENTVRQVLPRVGGEALRQAAVITIPPGEIHKSLDTLAAVWRALGEGGATRQDVLVNLGGGMVTDLGGLAAATFKRGMRFVNVPTTLLGAVDAAVGGKTGIDFGGLKNEVGVFAEAREVIVSTVFFDTLPRQELLSGYAEALKHGLLENHDAFAELVVEDPRDMTLEQLRRSVEVKRRIVARDPEERGPRRALNLGHTVGHALESLALQGGRPVPHGYAVAWGLVAEAVLSHMAFSFSSDDLHRLARFVRRHYGAPAVTCDDYPRLLALMRHDKKSRRGELNCTLLRRCGDPVTDNAVTDEDMGVALDIFRDLMGA